MGGGAGGCPAEAGAALRAVFSDMDGTIVHYEKDQAGGGAEWGGPSPSGRGRMCTPAGGGAAEEVLEMPPSAGTGVRGLISMRTLRAAKHLRDQGVAFVIISGVRYSTLMGRLPWLPCADAVVNENGGRVFLRDDSGLCTLPLVEDLEWRASLAAGAGPVGQEGLAPGDREGPVWDVYRRLVAEGWPVDATSYETMIRVKVRAPRTPEQLAEALRDLPPSLATAVNLSCTDVFPAGSGKANAFEYLRKRMGVERAECAALCDDDNDLGMAALAGRAFCPMVSHPRVAEAIRRDPGHFFVAKARGTFGSDEVLDEVLKWAEKGAGASGGKAAAGNGVSGKGSGVEGGKPKNGRVLPGELLAISLA